MLVAVGSLLLALMAEPDWVVSYNNYNSIISLLL